MNNTQPTSTEDRALALLGSGVNAEQTAAALGVTASAISQLLSNDAFSKQVETLRYENLQRHNVRDAAYDSLEDKLRESLEKKMALFIRPAEIVKALQVVNNLKRRGQSAPEQVNNQGTVVNILMPTQVINTFTTDINNQIIKAGEQDLLTIPSTSLLNKVRAEGEATSNTESPDRTQQPGKTDDLQHLNTPKQLTQ